MGFTGVMGYNTGSPVAMNYRTNTQTQDGWARLATVKDYIIVSWPSMQVEGFSMPAGIYQIFCRENKKRYVGSAQDLLTRAAQHLSDLRGGYHHNQHLQRAFNKYGERAFVFTILEFCAVSNVLDLEQFYLDNFPCEFNIARDAFAPMRGRVHTKKSKGKMSKSHLGENNHFYGKKHSEKTRAKMRGRQVSEEVKKALSIIRTGTTHSEETKRKIAARGEDRFKDPSERQRYSEIFSGENNPFYGKTHTKETKDKYRKDFGKAVRQVDKETKQVIAVFESIRQAADLTGVDRKSISYVAKGKKNYNTAGGYIWRFEDG